MEKKKDYLDAFLEGDLDTFLNDAADATIETLTPPTSIDAAKRLLDPRPGTFGVSGALQTAGDAVGSAVRNSVENIATNNPLAHNFPRATAAVTTLPVIAAEGLSDTLSPRGAASFIGMSALPIAGMSRALEKSLAQPFVKNTGLIPKLRNHHLYSKVEPQIAVKTSKGDIYSARVSQRFDTEFGHRGLEQATNKVIPNEKIVETGYLNKWGDFVPKSQFKEFMKEWMKSYQKIKASK